MTSFNENLAENLATMRGEVCDIFSQNRVIGGFICGSAVTLDLPTSDIDVLICCQDDVTEAQRHDWTEYYLDLHDRFGKDPDVVSPGELMSADSLRYGLGRILTMAPTTSLRNRYDFDYLCWAGMIDARKVDVIRTDCFVAFEKLAEDGIIKWSRALLGDRTTTRQTGQPTDADKLLARTVSCKGYYDAHK